MDRVARAVSGTHHCPGRRWGGGVVPLPPDEPDVLRDPGWQPRAALAVAVSRWRTGHIATHYDRDRAAAGSAGFVYTIASLAGGGWPGMADTGQQAARTGDAVRQLSAAARHRDSGGSGWLRGDMCAVRAMPRHAGVRHRALCHSDA